MQVLLHATAVITRVRTTSELDSAPGACSAGASDPSASEAVLDLLLHELPDWLVL